MGATTRLNVLKQGADVRWREIVTGTRKVNFEQLPLRILMMRIELERAQNLQSTQWVDKCSNDLQAFCARYLGLIQVDVDSIFEEGERDGHVSGRR